MVEMTEKIKLPNWAINHQRNPQKGEVLFVDPRPGKQFQISLVKVSPGKPGILIEGGVFDQEGREVKL